MNINRNIVLMQLISNVAAILANTGVFFKEVTQDDEFHHNRTSEVFSKTFHHCGLQEDCNFVVKHLKTNVYDRYEEMKELPPLANDIAVWEKVHAQNENSGQNAKKTRKNQEYASCKEAMEHGVKTNATINIPWGNGSYFQATCDMTTDGGGWTIFQRRFAGSVSFERDWNEYVRGFGNRNGGDFWLGLEAIHHLTKDGNTSLRFDLQNAELHHGYAEYSGFKVGNDASYYSISFENYRGNIGDAMLEVNKANFSTKDKDNDNYDSNCAEIFRGPWWYNACSFARLNSPFPPNGESSSASASVAWKTWTNSSIVRSEIKLRKSKTDLRSYKKAH